MEVTRGGGGGGGTYSAIDPAALARLVSSLQHDADMLQKKGTTLRSQLSEHSVETGAALGIIEIGRWAEDQLPELKHRQGLAQAMDAADGELGNQGMVTILEPSMSRAEAQAGGSQLAKRLNKLSHSNAEGAKLLHRVATELRQHKNDPAYTSAFFANLDPNIAQMLPSLLVATGSETASEDLRAYSAAFGTAVSAKYPAPGFESAKDSFTRPPEARGEAWNRLAMLQYGEFPADFLVEVTRVNALDEFAANPHGMDWRGAPPNGVQAYGLPSDTVALALSALSSNGAAARRTLASMGGSSHSRGTRGNINLFLDYANTVGSGFDVAESLGEAIESGAGVHTEQMGKHSESSARFAFDVIITVGDRSGVPWPIKDSLAELAGSYAPEMVAGSRVQLVKRNGPGSRRPWSQYPLKEAADRESVFPREGMEKIRPEGMDKIPGLSPEFLLAPKDTYQFFKTFAENERLAAPFDRAMNQLQQDLLADAIAADKKADDAGRDDPENFEEAATALGLTAGLEYMAQYKVRGDMDEFDKKVRTGVKDIVGYLVGKVPLTGLAWDSAKYVATKGMDATLKPDRTRTQKLEESEDAMLTSSLRDVMTKSVVQANWTDDAADKIKQGMLNFTGAGDYAERFVEDYVEHEKIVKG